MIDPNKLIDLHGLESTSNSGKACLFRERFPGMLTPDFTGSFEERMDQLYPILGDQKDSTIIVCINQSRSWIGNKSLNKKYKVPYVCLPA